MRVINTVSLQRRFKATTADLHRWQSFVGRQEQFSVIRANETAAKARATREHIRRVAAEAAAEKAAQQAAAGGPHRAPAGYSRRPSHSVRIRVNPSPAGGGVSFA